MTQNSNVIEGNTELGFFKSELNAELTRLNKVWYFITQEKGELGGIRVLHITPYNLTSTLDPPSKLVASKVI